ncbi:neugrin-like [Ptychodera flava]|uniref:neugrin-like n=1 Tax=Ptychodera flava TaxID=63121 RepID=UPI00396A954D
MAYKLVSYPLIRGLFHLNNSVRCIATSTTCSSYDKVLEDMKRATTKRGVPRNKDTDPDFLEAVEKERRRRQYGMLRAKTERELRQPKEKRILTRDAMNQIRFLRQEYPDEWTITRLAESFGVSQNSIIKVLKSRFTPNDRRQAKQDSVAAMNYGSLPPGKVRHTSSLSPGTTERYSGSELALQSKQERALDSQHKREKFPKIGTFTKIALTSKVVLEKLENMKIKGEQSAGEKANDNVKLKEDAIHSLQSEKPEVEKVGHDQDTFDKGSFEEEGMQPTVQEYDPENEFNDPHIDDVDYNFRMRDILYLDSERMKIIRKGNSFYDEDGNFLYRI